MDIDSRINSINTAAHLGLLRSHRKEYRSSDGDLPLRSDVLCMAEANCTWLSDSFARPTEYGRVESYYAWSGSGITWRIRMDNACLRGFSGPILAPSGVLPPPGSGFLGEKEVVSGGSKSRDK